MTKRIPGRTEKIGGGFTKYHVGPETDAPWTLRPVLHHFTEADIGTPHDHPWPFTTTICQGSYVEEVFTFANGQWSSEHFLRSAGETHSVEAAHIHRIVSLPDGECWTLVFAQPWQRKWRYWPEAIGLRKAA